MMFGKAPASPTPKRNRIATSDWNPCAAPVSIVNADHQSTIRVSTRRGPRTSPSHPEGTSKIEYASANALKTAPIWSTEMCKSFTMAGAAAETHTRSR
jgi:hypothetical protein